MYQILSGQVAVPAASVDLISSSSPSRGTDAKTNRNWLLWELQRVLQHQDSERLEFSASVRRVSWLFSIV